MCSRATRNGTTADRPSTRDKNLTIDASDLPNGITVKWNGGDASHARVLAVYGDLTMKNVTISSGYSVAEAIAGGTQPYTLARGGGLAVWGTAELYDCTIAGNTCVGESGSARDRGTYGGGIYANGLDLNDCVISGNSVIAYGAGGGGIYSVGGADNTSGHGNDTSLRRCTISGNRVTAQHAYGGGIFTLSGGPNNLATMFLTNCTIARNLVQDHPDYPQAGQWYNRGGGVYMGGGSLWMSGCTIAENAVTGQLAILQRQAELGRRRRMRHHRQRPHRGDRLAPEFDRRRQHAERRGRGLVRRAPSSISTARATTSSGASTSARSSCPSPTG